MGNTSRFPQLALPFAIVGGAAGWLSAGLLSTPVVGIANSGFDVPVSFWHAPVALCGAAMAGATGALLTRWCRGKRYLYELDAAGTEDRPPTDAAPRQALAVLAAGAVSGALVSLVAPPLFAEPGDRLLHGVVSGGLAATLFIPVFLAIIAAARRVSRARLGSLVAGSDRRAIWGILAILLSLATLAALPDWPASTYSEAPKPAPAAWLVLISGAVVLAILAADTIALVRARRALRPGLSQEDPMLMDTVDGLVPCVDLGLGDDFHAQLTRSTAAYRTRDRALSLVQGSPESALGALRRAVLRGAIGGVIIAGVFGAHMAATSRPALDIYAERRCGADTFTARSKIVCDPDNPSQCVFAPICP